MHVLQFQTIRNRAAVEINARRMSSVLAAKRLGETRASIVLRISKRGELQLNASAPDYARMLQPCIVEKVDQWWVFRRCLWSLKLTCDVGVTHQCRLSQAIWSVNCGSGGIRAPPPASTIATVGSEQYVHSCLRYRLKPQPEAALWVWEVRELGSLTYTGRQRRVWIQNNCR